jgi:hypothetical protein
LSLLALIHCTVAHTSAGWGLQAVHRGRPPRACLDAGQAASTPLGWKCDGFPSTLPP